MTLSLGFGIVFGTVLTLFLIPALYLILEDLVPRRDDAVDGAVAAN